MSLAGLGVVVRFGLYLDLMAAFGIAAFGVLSLRGSERGGALPLRSLIAAAGIVGAVLSVVGLFVLAAAMAGVPLSALDRESVTMLVTDTAVGMSWMVRMIALVLIALLPLAGWRRPIVVLSATALAGAVALATLAWVGHGAMDEGAIGWLHLVADVLHLLAAGIWLGALLCLSMLVMRRTSRTDAARLALTHRALDDFSVIGTIVVGVIVVTGIINAWLLVGPTGVRLLGQTLYGQVLLAKLGLFAVMIAFAAASRFRLVPTLGRSIQAKDHRNAFGALRRALALETGCAIIALGLVAWLGTLEPIASAA